MRSYEFYSLIAVSIYDFLTFLLLVFVVYESLIKPKIPNLNFYMQLLPIDTKTMRGKIQLADFILENRGIELKNIKIKSEPDDIKWDNIGGTHLGFKTSEYFIKNIPYLRQNAKEAFLWCDLEQNREIIKKTFKIIIEYDNPLVIMGFKKRSKQEFPFDFSFYDKIAWGMTNRYDIHNVAQELTRVREQLEKMK